MSNMALQLNMDLSKLQCQKCYKCKTNFQKKFILDNGVVVMDTVMFKN